MHRYFFGMLLTISFLFYIKAGNIFINKQKFKEGSKIWEGYKNALKQLKPEAIAEGAMEQ
jgi:SRSO17 transposase